MPSTSSSNKDCPRCSARLALDASACGCGYRFATDGAEDGSSSDLLARAEALFETHLRARLQRAVRAARYAKIDVLRDPQDKTKSTALREAEQEVKLIGAQLAVQIARTAQARARSEQAALESTSAVPVTDEAERFRAAQAEKAEETFALIRLQAATERLRTNQASGLFRAVQAEKARAAAPSNETTERCPDCGTGLKLGMAKCDCGYALTETKAAPDFISSEEIASLRSGE